MREGHEDRERERKRQKKREREKDVRYSTSTWLFVRDSGVARWQEGASTKEHEEAREIVGREGETGQGKSQA